MMELKLGTKEEHLATLQRAKDGGLSYVWSGDIRRNAYLRENLAFAEDEGIIKTTFVESWEAQESGWNIEWL
jgi:hypothetical protein